MGRVESEKLDFGLFWDSEGLNLKTSKSAEKHRIEFFYTTGGGVKTLRLPRRSPDLNAYAERWVRTIKENCLDQMIMIGERSLRRVVGEYVEHYNTERAHQSLENKIIEPKFDQIPIEGEMKCDSRLGGMLNYYRVKMRYSNFRTLRPPQLQISKVSHP